MRILFVTHPDAAARSPRPLSNGGRLQAMAAARRLRELAGKKVFLAAVLSSPAARCLETAVLVAREFGETTLQDVGFDRVKVCDGLGEGQNSISITELNKLLGEVVDKLTAQRGDGAADSAVLVSVHGDLASVLNSVAASECKLASDGRFFDFRPVVAGCGYDQGQLSVQRCDAFVDGAWATCL